MKISQKYHHIVNELTPFVYAYEENVKEFDLNAFSSSKVIQFSPFKHEDLEFFNLLKVLDKNSFQESGMGMDNWVFLDCAIMPSAIIGFAIHSSKASLEILETYNIDKSYNGFIPLSMFIAIPMVRKGYWFAHNLSSSNSFLKDKLKGLGLLTKAMGIKILKIKNLMGATQWGNHSLKVHTRLAKLKLESAHTPIHSHPDSIIYSCEFHPGDIENALTKKGQSVSNHKIDINDKDAIVDLNERVKSEDVYIVTGAVIEGKKSYVYLLDV